MQLGMIGLGRMGGNMTRRLLRGGHHVLVHDRDAAAMQPLVEEGASAARTLEDFVRQLVSPRLVWIMVPAPVVDKTIDALAPLLSAGDTVIDGGNSNFRDDLRRAQTLAARQVEYVDVGTSGGVWGLERGYCLMIGGSDVAVRRLDPIFRTLAPGIDAAPRTPGREAAPTSSEQGYLHCGGPGAGHFVKMVHNAIEYGLMAAYAEGFNLMCHAAASSTGGLTGEAPRYDFDLPAIAELWRRGSVVGSWLLDLTAAALAEDRELSAFAGGVGDSGEGRWAAQEAIDRGVPTPVMASALFARFSSRGEDDFANRLLSAMRHQFGGHEVTPKQ